MTSQVAQETEPVALSGDAIERREAVPLQQAPTNGASIELTALPTPEIVVPSSPISDHTGQSPHRQQRSSLDRTGSGTANKLKRWLTETRINLSIGLLGLILAIIFGAGAWMQSNLNQQSLDIALWTACLQNADNPQVQESKHCQRLLNENLDDFTKRDSVFEESAPMSANISQDFDSWMSGDGASIGWRSMAVRTPKPPYKILKLRKETERREFEQRNSGYMRSYQQCRAYKPELKVVTTAREIANLFNKVLEGWNVEEKETE